jgi:hypothetical protein
VHIVISRATGDAVALVVPDLTGLTPDEVARAVYAASLGPHWRSIMSAVIGTASIPGASAVLDRWTRYLAGRPHLPLNLGDRVHAAGAVLELTSDTVRHGPLFTVVESMRPADHPMPLSAVVPPPDEVAYVEDDRDRLWTGKGAGTWRCLTDAAGRTVPQSWSKVWADHGPLTPLVAWPVAGAHACSEPPDAYAAASGVHSYAGIGVTGPVQRAGWCAPAAAVPEPGGAGGV